MATAAVLPPRDVHTSLNYFVAHDDELPYIYIQPVPGVAKSNFGEVSHPTVIHNVRGKEDTIGLDKTGFQFVEHVSEEREFMDEEAITTKYYKEVEDLLKRETGAKRVFIFDHTIRRNLSLSYSKGCTSTKLFPPLCKESIATLAMMPNVCSRVVFVLSMFGGRSATLLLITRSLLLITTLLISTTILFLRVSYTRTLADQRPDEVTLIKCYDSDVDKARLTPHTAFADSTSPESAPRRQSIEVRALVFDSE